VLVLAREELVEERRRTSRAERLEVLLGGHPASSGLPDPELWTGVARLPERQADSLRLALCGLDARGRAQVLSMTEEEAIGLQGRALESLAAGLGPDQPAGDALVARLEAAWAAIEPPPDLADGVTRRLQRRPWPAGTRRPERGPVPAGVLRSGAAGLGIVAIVALALIAGRTWLTPPRPAPSIPAVRLAVPEEDESAAVASAGAVTVPYFGPARLTVTAHPPPVPARLVVYRWSEPPAGTLAGVGARDGGFAYPGPQVDREPLVILGGADLPPGDPPAPAEARRASDEFLTARGLLPSWASRVQVRGDGLLDLVTYTRLLDPGSGPGAPQVDRTGEPAGTEVAVGSGSTVVQVTLPVPLKLERLSFPARPSPEVTRAALTQPPDAPSGLVPVPEVTLDSVELVYVAMAEAGEGFYEPGYLFTGEFTAAGTTYQKRVLVPAIQT
jgi:hypothetical protein